MSQGDLFLVSGAAGGIGSAVCDALAERGYIPVVGYCKNHAGAEAVAARTGGQAIAIDMAAPASIIAACQKLAAKEKNLAGVILAGSPAPQLAPFGKISVEDMQQQWQVNVVGSQLLLSELVRHCFRKTKRGSVIGILTKAMGDGIGSASSGMGAYVIAKYGMMGMLAVLAADYPWLRVSSVSPGYTQTPMLEAFDTRFLELQRTHVHFSTPTEIAKIIVDEALRYE